MAKSSAVFNLFLNSPSESRRRKPVLLLAAAACSWMLGAAAAAAGPVIISQPFSANPGDVISLEGSGFGTAPLVYLKPSHQTTPVTLATKTADNGTVVVEVPKTAAFDLYEVWIANGGAQSPHIFINAPNAMHFDNADVASGAHFRVFGRNLYVNGQTPTVTLIDMQTNAQVNATVTLATSSAYCLDAVPASGIIAGHSYKASVSNGYQSVLSSTSILGHAAGTDHFSIGQPWAYDFQYQNVINVKTNTSLKIRAKGDGVTNDAAAIDAAMALAAVNGGIVYLPAGTYNTGATSIKMQSNVVLQGQSASNTKIIFGPALPGGVFFPPGTQMAGIADLSFQNLDTNSQNMSNIGTGSQTVSKVFLQRLNWNLATAKPIQLSGDRIAVLNSTFTQAINYQSGNPALLTGGMGPLYFGTSGGLTNFQFKNNVIQWATDENYITDAVNVIVENNHFTRSATDTIIAGAAQASWRWPATNAPVLAGQKVSRVLGRPLAMNFAKNLVIQNNIFDTSGGAILTNWNDGEMILNEAGAGHPREDYGNVTAASSSSVTGVCLGTCPWPVYTNAVAVIVSGAGAGQWRHITAMNGNTFTLDAPFNVIPAAGDHLTISQPAYENAIIRNNTGSGNPFGVANYRGAFFNVSIIANQLTNNGGIYFWPEQYKTVFNVSKNIEINGNILKNANGVFPSYIALAFDLITQTTFWGKSMLGVQVRNNQITAFTGTVPYPFREGYFERTNYQNTSGPYVENGTGAMVGTVFQGNSCTNCAINYTLRAGDIDTTIWNATTINNPGFASTLVYDDPMMSYTKQKSIGTVIGND